MIGTSTNRWNETEDALPVSVSGSRKTFDEADPVQVLDHRIRTGTPTFGIYSDVLLCEACIVQSGLEGPHDALAFAQIVENEDSNGGGQVLFAR
jgi:hypothetical protein